MPEQVLEVPSVLIGSVEQLCEEVLARWERGGISSVTVFEKQREAFALVVARCAGESST
jgi:hypothetical protein